MDCELNSTCDLEQVHTGLIAVSCLIVFVYPSSGLESIH